MLNFGHVSFNMLARDANFELKHDFLPDLIGVCEADGVCEGEIPKGSDGGAELLGPVQKQHTQQRREQSQQFVIVGQSSPGLQAAQNIPQKLFQLQEAYGKMMKSLKVKTCIVLCNENQPFPEVVK